MCTPAQLGAICADSTFFFFWCPVDITRELYAFVFQEECNYSASIQGTHSYIHCSIPRYLAWNPRVFLRRVCSNGQQIDVIRTETAKIEAYYRDIKRFRWFYLHIMEVGEPDTEISCARVQILGLVRVKTSILLLVNERHTTYLTDSIIPNQAHCCITIPDRFASCTGILLDADKLVHIEGELENGMTGLWTYCPNIFFDY